MKVIAGCEESKGRYPIIFPKSATPAEIYDWLWNNGYQGYQFCIAFNLMGDEYEEQGVTGVYFVDEVLEELATYSDFEIKKKGNENDQED